MPNTEASLRNRLPGAIVIVILLLILVWPMTQTPPWLRCMRSASRLISAVRGRLPSRYKAEAGP